MSEIVLHAPLAGWLAPLDEVADAVFADRMLGDGVAIDPVEGLLRAPADGEVLTVPATAHAVTMRLENGAELLMHVGLDTVRLGGEGFEARVKPGDRVRAGDPLIAFDLDAVARGAKDLVTPIVAVSDGATFVADRPGRRVRPSDVIGRVTSTGAKPIEAAPVAAVERSILVLARDGIHARPAARIVALLKPFAAAVTLSLGDREADVASVVALLALAAKRGDLLAARAQGHDAAAALDALAALAAEGFGDGIASDATPPVAAAIPVATATAASGVRASPGIAIGHVRQLRIERVLVPEDGAGVDAERASLAAAIAEVAATQRAGDIGDAHRGLLADPMLGATAERAIVAGRSAAYAWRHATGEAAAALRATGDPLLIERVADLDDLDGQVIGRILDLGPPPIPSLDPGTILVAEDLLPSQFLAIDLDRLAGIVTAAGGPTAHVAILAAAAGIPMLVAAGPSILAIPDGRAVILDADAAALDRAPDPAALDAAAARIAAGRAERAASLAAAHAPAVTRDGTRIEVFANLGSAADAATAVAAGAEGCGLLRTEFLFLDRPRAPDETEQRRLYARIATTLGERSLIVRTLDVGGDKPVPYLPSVHEDNPALGVRGIRLGLARPDLLTEQLRAIIAAVPGSQCRIMLPMIADLAELRAVRALVDAAATAVGRAEPVALGVMIETPAAALLADQLAREADFLSVGTNDLTQYALAADRGNAGVSAMLDGLHPAVLRLIAAAGRGAAAHRRQIGVCGGLASDPTAIPVLVGLGVTELSAVPAMVPAIKARVRELDLERCRALAGRACDATSAAEVRALIEEAT